MGLRHLVKGGLRRVGLDVRLVRNLQASARREWADKWADQWRFLQNHDIRTVLDVGANTGQFASMIRRVCPSARLLCFEPVRECFGELQARLGSEPRFQAFNVALGDRDGSTEIFKNAFSPCSSMLEPTPLLEQEYPESARREKETVTLSRLDTVLREVTLEPEILLKIDVEGYEPQVLRGAEATLGRALFVAVEIHFHEYYKGQPLFDDVYRMMAERGFVYRGSAGQYASPLDHRFAYADAIFENAGRRTP